VSRILVLLVVLGVPALVFAEEPRAEEWAFIEYVMPRTSYFVGEEIPVVLRFGYLPALFEQRGVALFRQQVDVPLRILAGFARDVDGTRSLSTERKDTEWASDVVRFALDDDIVEGRRMGSLERGGATYTVVEIERRLVAEEPGDARLAAPRLRFAHATRFEEDFLGGRTPLDRVDVEVEGREASLRIQPLPGSERPPAFSDAVGQFSVQASHEQGEGDPPLLHVTLEITGTGNLATLTPPSPQVFVGFHTYGVQSTMTGGVRRIRYELAPLSEQVTAIPAIPFAFLDPGPPPTYREVSTEAVPLAGRVPVAEAAPAVRDRDEGAPASEEHRSPVFEWLLLALVSGLLALAWWLRARGTPPPLVDEGRLERLATLRGRLAAGGGDVDDAFHAYLAQALDTTRSAVIGPDLASRLQGHGVTSDLATRVAQHVERTVGARYGGGPAPRLEAGLLEDLEAAFRAVEE
jgi:hypothetical protein